MRLPAAVVSATLVLLGTGRPADAQQGAARGVECDAIRAEFDVGDSTQVPAAASARASHYALHASFRGCPRVAVALYALAATRQPATAPVWLSYAATLLADTLHQPDSAVTLVAAAVATQPDDPELLELLGTLDLRTARWDDAHCVFVRMVALDSASAVAWAGLARTASSAGRDREAMAYWNRLALIDPAYLARRADRADSALAARSADAAPDTPPASVWLVRQEARRCGAP